jgi:hypothetical protein
LAYYCRVITAKARLFANLKTFNHLTPFMLSYFESQFWHFIIKGRQDETTGVAGRFYAYGEHLGEALEIAVKIAEQQGILSPHIIETYRLDNTGDTHPPDNAIYFEHAFMLPELQTFSLTADEPAYIPPTGIIKSTDDYNFQISQIEEGFVPYDKDDKDFYQLKLAVSSTRFFDTCIKCINLLPAIDGFHLYIYDFEAPEDYFDVDRYDEKETELWANKSFITHQQIVDFLTENRSSTIENGFIDCIAHYNTGETKVRIDQHKNIYITTKDAALYNDIIDGVAAMGFAQLKKFITLHKHFYHFHYRPMNSLNQRDFIKLLKTEGFEKLNG